jgi:hypothetical protein
MNGWLLVRIAGIVDDIATRQRRATMLWPVLSAKTRTKPSTILPMVFSWVAAASAGPDVLQGIPIQPEHAATPYHRVHWMPGGSWTDADGDCQDGREEILIDQSKATPILTADGCSIIRGLWVDPYTGETTDNPSDVEIDHLVALKEAHDSGGASWPPTKKQAFAQDVTAGNLFVAMTSTNRSKGDRDPGEWLPANKSRSCWYVKQWAEVKRRWGLSMDQTEAKSIRHLMASCL